MTLPASTADVAIPERLIDQIIGQDHALEAVRLAARQHRFLLLVGEPGTGKSLIGQAMAELLGAVKLHDLVAEENHLEPFNPRVRSVAAGVAETVKVQSIQAQHRSRIFERFSVWVLSAATIVLSFYHAFREGGSPTSLAIGAVVVLLIHVVYRRLIARQSLRGPKILVAHPPDGSSPFVDATGCQAGALLGDVRHDPYQSGGAETPPHQLLEAGAIHRAHGGVLFIDEVSTLSLESQQSLLTAIQEKKMPILGRSPGSSGTMVCSEAVPCEFLLIVAGNMDDIDKMHPALRSRLRGYGYEILTNDILDDSPANVSRMVQFMAQEVQRDGRIPHLRRDGIEAILEEAQRRSGTEAAYSARFRELGGLIRIAGDLAVQENADLIDAAHVERARTLARSLEEQLPDASVNLQIKERAS